jgi:hypothetical protein
LTLAAAKDDKAAATRIAALFMMMMMMLYTAQVSVQEFLGESTMGTLQRGLECK